MQNLLDASNVMGLIYQDFGLKLSRSGFSNLPEFYRKIYSDADPAITGEFSEEQPCAK